MKRLFSVIAAVVFVFCFSITAFAGGGSGGGPGAPEDSLRMAQVFGGISVKAYEGNFNFRRSGADEWVNVDFKMSADGKITYLKVQDVVIVAEGDEPLPGLPVNKKGETRDFNLNLWTVGAEPSAHGYFYSQLLLPGDPIVVYLSPNYVRREVKFSSGDGIGKILQTKDGATSTYDASIRGFYIWVNPAKVTEYSIFDPATRVVYQRGTINPLEDTTTAPTSHLVTVKLPVGIEQAPDERWSSFSYQKLDGFVDGASAKVYIWDLKKSGGSVEVYGLTGGNITVLRWVELGVMPKASTTSDGGYTRVESGYDRVIVIVTGEASEEGFSIYFNRW
ncbi:MAG: hypothetical protein UY16_C0062G0003 [Candidatus Gottesmanbacteria bacterium GW2011_GWA2_47_9]|uniref:Uncharacterized protein n=1 Tax=Candidatus Gottesmanbacteria bacterium GW2011_GWA2_47_9 TaxID=1618445 RepID=A0A0G1TWK0_9BACT|nr:MAG: hypothetical protein UY16_C0062G0003 [Candidatus Gottesmanbacteria bacterium GW2011_GWA2_47_9]